MNISCYNSSEDAKWFIYMVTYQILYNSFLA